MLRKKNSEPAQLPEARQELLGFESPAAQPGKKDPKQFLKHNWKKITAVVCVAAVAAAVLLPKTSKKDVQASTQYVEAALERRDITNTFSGSTRKNPAELKALRQAGLNHLYSGMETGSDRILKLINKGFDADTVVRSGCMAKDADMILSEFILLGIGGKELSEENAAQTAKALNIIQPDFIRVHATGIKPESKLGEFVRDGSFTLQSEEEIVIEQKLFLQQLHEMDSYYVNEHIVNLLLEIRGNLRTEKQEMLSTIDRFLTLPPDERLLFTVGRRLNIFFRLDDLKKPKLHQKAGESLQQILSKNPHVDFAALCNYVRQSQI